MIISVRMSNLKDTEGSTKVANKHRAAIQQLSKSLLLVDKQIAIQVCDFFM